MTPSGFLGSKGTRFEEALSGPKCFAVFDRSFAEFLALPSMSRIVDRIDEIHASGGTVVSFEFFPAKVCACSAVSHAAPSSFARGCDQTEDGVTNLLDRIGAMSMKLRPTFVTLTWRSSFLVRVRSRASFTFRLLGGAFVLSRQAIRAARPVAPTLKTV